MIEMHSSKIKLFAPPPIPTALTLREARTLYGMACNQKVAEFGSLLGFSTVVLGQSAERVWAFDPHEGYPTADPRPTWEPFQENLKRYGVDEVVIPVRAKAQECKGLLHHISPLHLIFIDITREAWPLLNFAAQFSPKIIAVHDYGIKKWVGATLAVNRFSKETGRKFRLVDTLAVFE